MELIIATNNKHKLKEIRDILKGKFDKIYSLSDKGIEIDVVEDGKTFTENAIKKAVAVYNLTKTPCLADDSGLCVEALFGAPGIYSARYSGIDATDEKNNAKLLKELEDKKNRRAFFETAVAMCLDENTIITASGTTHGSILYKNCGTNGFGYDPLFLSDELNITFAECTEIQKNSVSHRARALHNLLKKL